MIRLSITLPDFTQVGSVAELKARSEELQTILSWIESRPPSVSLDGDAWTSTTQSNVSEKPHGEPDAGNKAPDVTAPVAPTSSRTIRIPSPPIGERTIDWIIRVLQADAEAGNSEGLERTEIMNRMTAQGWTSKNPIGSVTSTIGRVWNERYFVITNGRVKLSDEGMAHHGNLMKDS